MTKPPRAISRAANILKKRLGTASVARWVVNGKLYIAAQGQAADDINRFITERTGQELYLPKDRDV